MNETEKGSRYHPCDRCGEEASGEVVVANMRLMRLCDPCRCELNRQVGEWPEFLKMRLAELTFIVAGAALTGGAPTPDDLTDVIAACIATSAEMGRKITAWLDERRQS